MDRPKKSPDSATITKGLVAKGNKGGGDGEISGENDNNSASGNDNDGEATNNDDAAAPADGDNGDDNNGDEEDDDDDNNGDDGDGDDDAAGGISDVGKGLLGNDDKKTKKKSLKGAAKKVSAANKFMKGLVSKEVKKLVKDEESSAKDDGEQDAEEAPADGDAGANDGGDDGGDAGGGDDADADPSGGGGDLGLDIGGVGLDDVIPAGPIVKALMTRLSSDPSKRKTFKKQMSEASYTLRDKVYRRYKGIHFSPKSYAYYFTWSAYDLKKYCFMLGLDFRKHPAKTTVAAAVAFVGKHGSKKTIQYTVGYLPGVNSCIDATFNRYDKVKMLIEHLEKWCVLEDFLPSNREEWETFIKVHAEIAAKRSADYPPDTAPWTTEQEATFVDKLRTLHNKDQMLPMKVCDVLGAGVPKKIPTKRNFDYEKMDDSPMFYSYFRRGFTGVFLKALYGGSWDVCQRATKAIREANVPYDIAFDLLKRPVEFKRKWGEYVRSIFLAARQKYVKRPPLDWKAYQEALDKRIAIEKFIVQRNAERKLKKKAYKKQKQEAAAAKGKLTEEEKKKKMEKGEDSDDTKNDDKEEERNDDEANDSVITAAGDFTGDEADNTDNADSASKGLVTSDVGKEIVGGIVDDTSGGRLRSSADRTLAGDKLQQQQQQLSEKKKKGGEEEKKRLQPHDDGDIDNNHEKWRDQEEEGREESEIDPKVVAKAKAERVGKGRTEMNKGAGTKVCGNEKTKKNTNGESEGTGKDNKEEGAYKRDAVYTGGTDNEYDTTGGRGSNEYDDDDDDEDDDSYSYHSDDRISSGYDDSNPMCMRWAFCLA